METNIFMKQIKELETKENITFDQIKGDVTNIEEIDYNLYKLSVIIEKVEYDGLYIKCEEKPLIETIFIKKLCLMKEKQKNIKILVDLYKHLSSSDEYEYVNSLKNKAECFYDLDFNFPKILNNKDEKYQSGIFIYKYKKDNLILLNTFEELNVIKANIISIGKNSRNDINKFFDKISDGTIVYIENFLMKNGNMNFTNFTTYNLADGEFLSEYFKKKYDRENNYYEKNIYYNIPLLQKYNSNYLFIKVIDITDEFIICIEQCPKLYKIKKTNQKLNRINDIYTFILIRNYKVLPSEDIYILEISQNSDIRIFENSLFNSFINNLTVINIYFPDFLPESKNYFQKISFEDTSSFEIKRNYENIIINYKNGNFFNYLPFMLTLINNKKINRFQFLLYYGLLNRINCLINYNSEDNYSCEYFYYNHKSLAELPIFTIKIGKSFYILKNYDTFNSQTRKRFIVINSPKNKYIDVYNTQYTKLNIEKNIKKEKEQKTKIIDTNNINKRAQNNLNLINKKELESFDKNRTKSNNNNKNIELKFKKMRSIDNNKLGLKHQNRFDLKTKNKMEINEKNNKTELTEQKNKSKLTDKKEINAKKKVELNESDIINVYKDINISKNSSINNGEEEENIDFIPQPLKDSLQFIFYFDRKSHNTKLIGIFNINEIEPEEPIFITEHYLEKYKIFYNYYKILIGEKKPENNYLENLKKFGKDKDLSNLVHNYYYFGPMKYKYYIIYINMCLYFYYEIIKQEDTRVILLKKFKNNFELIKKSDLSFSQKIRIMRFTCKECLLMEYINKDFNLFLLDELSDDNVFKLAFNYNIQIINNITEQSKLYLPFLQFDNFILFNYYVNSYSYSLSLEPLLVTKKHLLSLYEKFFFISTENTTVKTAKLACQCEKNDITTINKLGLFGELVGSSTKEKNRNYVPPISMELFHEKNGHSKKRIKNKKSLSPIYFYKKNDIIELDKKNQKIVGTRGESGRIIEYFIEYKKINLVNELKTNFNYGHIINDVKYFTSSNFKKLYGEMVDSSFRFDYPETNKQKKYICEIFDERIITNGTNKNKKFNEKFDDKLLESYEKKYLWRGKYFVYPDSIPFIYDNSEVPLGLKLYLEKYKNIIEEARKFHYGLDL